MDDRSDHHPGYTNCSQDPEPLEVAVDCSNDDATYAEELCNPYGFPNMLIAEPFCLIDGFLMVGQLNYSDSPDAKHQENCCNPYEQLHRSRPPTESHSDSIADGECRRGSLTVRH
jgi:hypothetical protein